MKIVELKELDFRDYVRPGDGLMWGQAAAEPVCLTQALMDQRHAIGAFEAFIGATWSGVLTAEMGDRVHFRSYCGAADNRKLARAGVLDILPCHYSQLPALIRCGAVKVDVLMLQVAPEDGEGRYSLSLASEYLLAAIDVARTIIVEINDCAPRTIGERWLTADQIDIAIHSSRPPPEPPRAATGLIEQALAKQVAQLIPDGATLQFGIGAIPEAVLAELKGHRNLGIHTGALVDAAVDLIEAGIVNNACKKVHRGVSIAGVAMGGAHLRRFLDGNRDVLFCGVEYTHDLMVLSAIDGLVAINSAVEVDLTGQVNAEVAGGVYVGAVGGSLDFIRGAHRSNGGLPIIALPATAGTDSAKTSRIVSKLTGPVTTPRCDVGVIVTEYGAADLRGLPISKRLPRMIELAAPEYREALARDAYALALR